MKRVYEKPVVESQDLFLFDGVAETCWGYHEGDITVEVYYDANHNGVCDSSELESRSDLSQVVGGGSCNEVATKLGDFVSTYNPEQAKQYYGTRENTKGVGAVIKILYS